MHSTSMRAFQGVPPETKRQLDQLQREQAGSRDAGDMWSHTTHFEHTILCERAAAMVQTINPNGIKSGSAFIIHVKDVSIAGSNAAARAV
jgi:hypothetical protein